MFNVRIPRNAVEYPVLFLTVAEEKKILKVFEKKRRAFFLIDEVAYRAQKKVIDRLIFSNHFSGTDFLVLKATEKTKSFSVAKKLAERLLKKQFTRKDYFVAIGGGVIGDVGGFVASIYHRGMKVVHFPSTLLSMVDSSVGGKTAVNHGFGKNLIGSFYQPHAVIAWLAFLETLPESEVESGFGEIYKYAVGFSPRLASILKKNSMRTIMNDKKMLTSVLELSVGTKVAIVSKDEFETQNTTRFDRRFLNFGHTIGHAIEKAYQIPHGVAVAIGVGFAAKIGVELKMHPQALFEEAIQLAQSMGLKTLYDVYWSPSDIMKYLRQDKKAEGDLVNFVFLKSRHRLQVKTVRLEDVKNVLHEICG